MVAAVLVAGSEKAAAHRLGLSHSTVKHHLANARSKVGATTTAQLVWILGPRLPEPDYRRSRPSNDLFDEVLAATNPLWRITDDPGHATGGCAVMRLPR